MRNHAQTIRAIQKLPRKPSTYHPKGYETFRTHPQTINTHPQTIQKPSRAPPRSVATARWGPAAGGVALRIRHSALGHSSGVFAPQGRTSLSLRSLRLAHKSTSKLVLLVLVTRVCQAAFREVRSRRGETIGFRGMAAITRAAIVTPP